jgi:polysaccharide transporter, PST family
MSLTIVCTSLSVIHLALLKRAMLFSTTSAIDVATNVIAIALTIVLASPLFHWQYWALVAGQVMRPILQAAGAWWLCPWMPGAPRRGVGTGRALKFAMNIYGRFSVNYFARNTDNLLVGWRFGAGPLGFYKKAYDLFLLSATALVSPLTNVAVSALSRFERHSAQFKRYLLNSLGVTAFIGMGLGADLTLVGKDVIRLVLGPKWEVAGQIFTFFGPGIGIMFLYGTIGWIHLSIGTADRWFRWVVAEFAVTGSLFLIGLRRGPAGIAMAWTMSFWILAVPAFWYAGKPIQLGVGAVAGAVWRYILASAVAGVGAAFIIPRGLFLGSEHSLVSTHGWVVALERILVNSALFAVLYVAAVIVLHGSLRPLHQIANLAREMAPRGWFQKPAASPENASDGVELESARAREREFVS